MGHLTEDQQSKLNSHLIEAFQHFDFKKCIRLIKDQADPKVLNSLSIPYFYLNSAIYYQDQHIINAFNSLIPYLDLELLNKKNERDLNLFSFALDKKQANMASAYIKKQQSFSSPGEESANQLLFFLFSAKFKKESATLISSPSLKARI